MSNQVDNLLVKFQFFPAVLNPRTADTKPLETLQEALDYLGFDSGLDVRGLVPKWHQIETIEKALQSFQKENNCFPADGNAGHDTQKALIDAIREKRNQSKRPVGSEQEVIEFMIAWIYVNHKEIFENGIKNLSEILLKYEKELGLKEEVLDDGMLRLLPEENTFFPNLQFNLKDLSNLVNVAYGGISSSCEGVSSCEKE